MHPATAPIAFSAHIRDLQRELSRDRGKRPRRRRAWIRRGR